MFSDRLAVQGASETLLDWADIMSLEYVLLVGVIGVPLGIFILRFVDVIALLYEISASLWMLPL